MDLFETPYNELAGILSQANESLASLLLAPMVTRVRTHKCDRLCRRMLTPGNLERQQSLTESVSAVGDFQPVDLMEGDESRAWITLLNRAGKAAPADLGVQRRIVCAIWCKTIECDPARYKSTDE